MFSVMKHLTMRKIIEAQINIFPWEDLKEAVHHEMRTTMWDSFLECLMLYLLQFFRHNSGKSLKYYITNMLRKCIRVPIMHFFQKDQLNSYLKTLPCINYVLRQSHILDWSCLWKGKISQLTFSACFQQSGKQEYDSREYKCPIVGPRKY